MAKPGSPGVYGATYSGVPVFEYQFGVDLKEHVMRRRGDDWVNATHILKAAGFDKPARTRILEREVQKELHEKIQGGYGKYQGTWIPLNAGEALAQRNNVYDRLRPIFEYAPGGESPPPAPRHISKPKAPRKPAVPKWSTPVAPPVPVAIAAAIPADLDNADVNADDDTPDDLTVASASYAGEDDRFDPAGAAAPPGAAAAPGPSAPNSRRRKRDETVQDLVESQHAVYGDELLDYFLLSRNEQPAVRPEPPPNFQPNWLIDTEKHTALHWASAMGDIDVIRQLKRFGASLAVQNIRGETPFMRAVHFTNCFEKQTFPHVMRELLETADMRDAAGCTVIHHAAAMKNGRITSHTCSRYYLDNILNRLQELHDPAFVQQLVDAQDRDGNTALHLAALRNARKCIRALLGRKASTDIPNHNGVRAEELILELNTSKMDHLNRRTNPNQPAPPQLHPHQPPQQQPLLQRSSSPFGPTTSYSARDAAIGSGPAAAAAGADGELGHGHAPLYHSAAANMVQTRITPLVVEKLSELARRYDEDWVALDKAEREARRLLAHTRSEQESVDRQIADVAAQLEPDDVAAKLQADANLARHQLLSLISQQNRVRIQQAADQEMARLGASGGIADLDESAENRLRLGRQLTGLLDQQHKVEAEYVDALSEIGTGDKIEKYRRLLRRCLDQQDGDNLDMNLDNLIEMMEEERDVGVVAAAGIGGGIGAIAVAGVAGDPMEMDQI